MEKVKEMPKVLNAQEAAEYLGVHVETIRRLARGEEIPAMKVGRGWRFQENLLIHWAKTHHLRSKQPHILVIDYEQTVLKEIQRVLSREGYRISTATKGEQALKIIVKDIPDVVLLELKIPGMKAPSIIKKIQNIKKGMPVIIISDHPERNLMMEAMHYAPVVVLPKPLKSGQIVTAVKLALKRTKARKKNNVEL